MIEQSLYDEIDGRNLAFSPDSSHLVYSARRGRKWFVVFDGKEQNPYDEIIRDRFRFSPDGSRFAYVAMTGKKYVAVVDGKEGGQYEGNSAVTFSPDSKHLAYAVQIHEREYMYVIDGIGAHHYYLIVPYAGMWDSADTFHYLVLRPVDVSRDSVGLYLVEEKIVAD